MDQRRLRREAGSRRGNSARVGSTQVSGRDWKFILPVGVRGRYIFETHYRWSGLFGIGAAGVAAFSVEGDVHLDNAYWTGGKGTVPHRLGDGHPVGVGEPEWFVPGRTKRLQITHVDVSVCHNSTSLSFPFLCFPHKLEPPKLGGLLRRRIVVRPDCPIVLLVSSSSSNIWHSLLPSRVARALLHCAFLPLLDLSEPEPSKLEGCWFLRLGEVLELGVRSPNVSVLLVSFVPFLPQLCYDSCWDFNVHNQVWLHSSRTTRGVEHAEETCYMHGVEQVGDQPPHGCNTLDQMMTDLPVESFVSVLPPFGKSDHACLLADFQIRA